jgi:hypothetical protein
MWELKQRWGQLSTTCTDRQKKLTVGVPYRRCVSRERGENTKVQLTDVVEEIERHALGERAGRQRLHRWERGAIRTHNQGVERGQQKVGVVGDAGVAVEQRRRPAHKTIPLSVVLDGTHASRELRTDE